MQAFAKVKSGEVVYNFPVDMESTYGNSIFPGNKIDIYIEGWRWFKMKRL